MNQTELSEKVENHLNHNSLVCWESEMESGELCMGVNQVRELIRTAISEALDNWVSVEERLPEEDLYYWVLDNNNHIHTAYFDGKDWWCDEEIFTIFVRLWTRPNLPKAKQ